VSKAINQKNKKNRKKETGSTAMELHLLSSSSLLLLLAGLLPRGPGTWDGERQGLFGKGGKARRRRGRGRGRV
jgi:hypothetical protein